MAGRRDWIVGIVIGGAFIVFTVATLLLVFTMQPGDGMSLGGFGDRVGIVEVTGSITSSETAVRQLRRFSEDESIPAIVLRINSPGGGVAASQEIYSEVLRVRDKGKVVVASMSSVAASGGLYIAIACDHIVANPGTLTGSIGVILQFPTAEELFDKVGIQYETVKSGQFKDVGNISRNMREDEHDILQDVIDDTYEQFIEAVAEGRGLELDSVRTFADGRIFTGRQAQGLGLVDELGDLQVALNSAAEMVDLDTPPETVRAIERRRPSILDFVGRTLVDWVMDYMEEQRTAAPELEYRFPY
ncbi:MAG: signal peptide peptidase SppA [candidate division Zixibacteria bacterium]|nr:signal peptide peptidase SppA [candidate division Zixibacteria bacterium]